MRSALRNITPALMTCAAQVLSLFPFLCVVAPVQSLVVLCFLQPSAKSICEAQRRQVYAKRLLRALIKSGVPAVRTMAGTTCPADSAVRLSVLPLFGVSFVEHGILRISILFFFVARLGGILCPKQVDATSQVTSWTDQETGLALHAMSRHDRILRREAAQEPRKGSWTADPAPPRGRSVLCVFALVVLALVTVALPLKVLRLGHCGSHALFLALSCAQLFVLDALFSSSMNKFYDGAFVAGFVAVTHTCSAAALMFLCCTSRIVRWMCSNLAEDPMCKQREHRRQRPSRRPTTSRNASTCAPSCARSAWTLDFAVVLIAVVGVVLLGLGSSVAQANDLGAAASLSSRVWSCV